MKLRTPGDLRKELQKLLRLRRSSLLLAKGLYAFAGMAVLTLLFIVVDNLLRVGSVPRQVALALVILLPLGGWLIRCLPAFRLRARDLAPFADQASHDPRPRCRSAFELQGLNDLPPYQQFLVGLEVDRAMHQIDTIPRRDFWPMESLRRGLIWCLSLFGIFLLAWVIYPAPTRTALRRLYFPTRDVPPWSRFEWVMDSDNPSVIYGQALELAVQVGGARIRQPVELLTKTRGEIHHSPCFQEGASHYVQRLERVIEPMSFCFRTGRARTRWYPVRLLMQPRIESATLQITPPAYSKKAQRSFAAGTQPLEALAHSTLQLDIRSNRPLQKGRLYVTGPSGDRTIIPGQLQGQRTLRFTWSLDARSQLSASIQDVRGVSCERPLELTQSVLPDQPPRVLLHSPTELVRATPTSIVPLTGQVEDDLGLREIRLARTIGSFRDRAVLIVSDLEKKHFEWESSLDLGALGVHPGQRIECYLEASDSNPDLSGMSASSIGAVEIISEEDYTEILRLRTTTDAFMARFRAAEEALREVTDALERLARVQEGEDNAAESLLAEAIKDLEQADQLYAAMAEDYAIYDRERNLQKAVRGARANLAAARTALREAPPSPSGLSEAARKALQRLADPKQNLKILSEEARDLAKAARLMEQAARFRRLVLLQENLVKRLRRYDGPVSLRDHRRLEVLADQQEAIRFEWDGTLQSIREWASQVPHSYARLRETAFEFVRQAEELGVPPVMQRAQDAANLANGRKARQEASNALNLMRKLLSSCSGDGFGGMCEPTFGVPDFEETLQSMFRSMCLKYGVGQGVGLGGGGGAGAGNGFWMAGNSLAAPVMGPPRLQFNLSGFGASGEIGASRARGNASGTQTREQQMEPESGTPTGGAGPYREPPAHYRRALERYFSDESEIP